MSRFKNTLSLFLASIPMLVGRSYAIAGPDAGTTNIDTSYDPITLRPLNYPTDNLFASHRSHSSHSSHASHSSHYSGSSGSPSYELPKTPVYASPTTTPSSTTSTSNSSTVPLATLREQAQTGQGTPSMTLSEKRILQIMRVQIALTRLDLYQGRISGDLDAPTKKALVLFQHVKGFSENGLMTTETLNALGVLAVQ